MKGLIIGMALTVIVVVPPRPASAQSSRDTDARRQVGCFRGRPLPAWKSFWIVEMQGSSPIVQSSRRVRVFSDPEQPGLPDVYTYPVNAFASVLEWNLGHMVNLGDKFALGGVVTVGTGGGNALDGLKLRLRRWLNSDLSVEAEAGALWSNEAGTLGSNAIGGPPLCDSTSEIKARFSCDGMYCRFRRSPRHGGATIPEVHRTEFRSV